MQVARGLITGHVAQAARRVEEALLSQRGHLLLWVPVCLGLGIGLWFGLRDEPGLPGYVALGCLGLAALAGARIAGEAAGPLLVGLALVAAGAGLAGLRAHQVAAPKIEFRYYGPIEGRVVRIDRSAAGALRLTLDQVRLERMEARRTPERVRVSLYGGHGPSAPAPGQVVILTGHLSPPGGPVEPGGFDFARNAFFDRLGAVGYTRTPLLILRPPDRSGALWIHRIRASLSQGLQARMPEGIGGVAAAIITGDRSGIPDAVTEDLRHANLAHLLAISGLHMGLLTGFVFGALRYGMALWPHAALHWPVKRIAAGIALCAGGCYLALSGGSVATERAFIMVSVMLVAVMLGRRALTLRAVAIAATIVLIRRPEELMGPGFQMSFAATTALVAAYGMLREMDLPRVPYLLRTLGGVFFSSLVAGLATAPFAAAHFNLISHYGLVANLLAVPVMGTLIMPAAVLAACLWLVGLEGVGLWIMEQGLSWVIFVADRVAAMPGAVGHVPSPSGALLPVLALGLLWLILWRGPLRWGGVAALPVALALWLGTDRPDLLISPSGGMIGVMTAEGRVVSRPRGEGFAASSWMENDGDPVAQSVAAAREGLEIEGRVILADLAGVKVLNVRGKTARAALAGCGGADILVVDTIVEEPPRPCLVLDPVALSVTGAVAGYLRADGLHLVTARSVTGDRYWTPAPRRDAPKTPLAETSAPLLARLQ